MRARHIDNRCAVVAAVTAQQLCYCMCCALLALVCFLGRHCSSSFAFVSTVLFFAYSVIRFARTPLFAGLFVLQRKPARCYEPPTSTPLIVRAENHTRARPPPPPWGPRSVYCFCYRLLLCLLCREFFGSAFFYVLVESLRRKAISSRAKRQRREMVFAPKCEDWFARGISRRFWFVVVSAHLYSDQW